MRSTFWPNRIFQRSRSKNRFAAFYENCTKRTFQAMRRTFWPNRIFQRSRSKNRSAGLKFTPINENGRLSMKIVQNVLFRPCGGRFGQIAFFNVPDPKIALPLSMKTVPNVLFRPCGGRFDQIAFLNVSEPKIALRDRNLRQYVKTVSFVWKLYKTCFSGHAGNVLAKSHFSKF